MLGAATPISGSRSIVVPAPLDELPLFVRAGAVLPLLPPDVDTLAGRGDPALDLVTLDDRRDRLVLLAFPRGRSEAAFNRRGRLRSLEGSGRWELAIRGSRRRTYDVAASLSTLASPFVPCAVAWNGRALDAGDWRWDEASGVLRARIRGTRGRLVVREACA